jgi:superfamily II DNA or RNA helicase
MKSFFKTKKIWYILIFFTGPTTLTAAPRPPALCLSPQGQLALMPFGVEFVSRETGDAFGMDGIWGLFCLGLLETKTLLPLDLAYWRDFCSLYFTELLGSPGILEQTPASCPMPELREDTLGGLIESAPFFVGGEYLTRESLLTLWSGVHRVFQGQPYARVEDFLAEKGGSWNQIGRVTFHLAENPSLTSTPFAFLATYTPRLSHEGKPLHLPLGKALDEYRDQGTKLIKIMTPIQRTARESSFLRGLLDRGEIFRPLSWSSSDAYAFLKDIPLFEEGGISVRLPNFWSSQRRPKRPEITVCLEEKDSTGGRSLFAFSPRLALDGEALTEEEIKALLDSGAGLILLKGQWVEVDGPKLRLLLSRWKTLERAHREKGLSYTQAMQLLSGVGLGSSRDLLAPQWVRVEAPLRDFKKPSFGPIEFGEELRATLRPYQKAGVEWLWNLYRLGLGACLADDMGLGKTLQVIAFLLLVKKETPTSQTLLVVPASLLGNWAEELVRFAPDLPWEIVHPSYPPVSPGTRSTILITTYTYLLGLDWVREKSWDLVILDEAQQIKNPASHKTLGVKALAARHRIALTGTPIENNLGDLWSLYDFFIPGLLGSWGDFANYLKDESRDNLGKLINPYLLRRLKTDQSVSPDLPEKIEVKTRCVLTKKQTVLYQEALDQLVADLKTKEGPGRKGAILKALTGFKQICNHPSQYLGDGEYAPQESGKILRLIELCQEIRDRGEKVLVFTQFRGMVQPLMGVLTEVFLRPGLGLSGSTPIPERKSLVSQFQDPDGPPFFVITVKAGGTGLTLTEASHVIHFDRWWNPAVENQASDRAYRIGQKKTVLVHKFMCRGTIEEKIDAIMESKTRLSSDILQNPDAPKAWGELSDSELIHLISLRIPTS